ncbi:hypothetical protein RND81_09G063200 [Saponaria officinalis]|uniref:Uncharacterized protein n=1 Tax=Saponaria officinalis TaxID=3572 RepID=A0AAW1IHA8_SAPOF
MERFDANVRRWTDALGNAERTILRNIGVGVFLGFRQLRVEPDFLDACLKFWDPLLNVFRFPSGEVCPLVEEFSAIGGWSHRAVQVALRTELSYRAQVQNFLELSGTQVDDLFEGQRINMLRLSERFSNLSDTSISAEARRKALSFCLIHRYAFCDLMDERAFGLPRLVGVVEQMMVGRNPTSLILGETLVGLTDRLTSSVHEYRGSPRILQIWLMERLSVLAPVPFGVAFAPGGVTTRARSWAGPSDRRLGYFDGFVRERPIRWVVPWWGLTTMTASTLYGSSRGYTVCSFEMAIRIHPWRVLRQFGRVQKIPP